MSRKAIDELKQQIPLLDYLEAHHWRPVRRLSRSRWIGLCPGCQQPLSPNSRIIIWVILRLLGSQCVKQPHHRHADCVKNGAVEAPDLRNELKRKTVILQRS